MTAHTYPWKLRSASAMGILRSTGITPWLTFSSCIIFLCLLWALLSSSGLLCSICNESAGDLCDHWRTAVFSFLINCTKAVNNYIIIRTFNYRHRPSRVWAVAPYAVLEANGKVNGIGEISHPSPSPTLRPIWMSLQICHYVRPGSRCAKFD